MWLSHSRSSGRGNICKAPVAEVSIDSLSLLECYVQPLTVDSGEDMAVRHEDIRPAVVVEIKKAYSPSQVLRIDAQPGLKDSVIESAVAVIMV